MGEQPATETTGHPGVDEALASLEGLADRPVHEHVAVFEAAHDRLRAALENAGVPRDAPAAQARGL